MLQQSLTTFYLSLVHPLLSSLPTSTPYTAPLTLPLFLHSHTLTSTRSFLIDSTSFHSLALVPLADLFNHEQEGVHNCQFVSEVWVCGECGKVGACEHDGEEDVSRPPSTLREEEDKEDTCDLLTLSPLLAGSEAFNHYGPRLSNAKLAIEYGFRVEANEWDVVEWGGVGEVYLSLVGEAGEEREGVEERWRELLAQKDLSKGIGEDHPLIAPFPPSSSADEAARTTLLVDADARLSPALWVLLVLLAFSPAPASSPLPEPAQLTRLASALRVLAERDEDEDEEEDGEDGEVKVPEEDLTLLQRVGELVRRLVEARIAGQREPELSGGELLERAEVRLSSLAFFRHFLSLLRRASTDFSCCTSHRTRQPRPPVLR